MEDDEKTRIKSSQKAIQSLGNFHRAVLILVDYPDFPIISDDDLAFTQKWMKPVNLSMDDVAIVNLTNSNTSYSEIDNLLLPKIILAFGMSSRIFDLPLQFPDYQVQHFKEQTFLCTSSLSDIAMDETLKKKFWGCLKKLFLNG